MIRSAPPIAGPFKNRWLRLLAVAVLFIAGCLACLGYTLLSPHSARNLDSALSCTRAWGRLAPFPVANGDVVLETEGGIFTRSFRASFVANAAEIEAWLQHSPGIQDAVASAPSPGRRHFTIKPGGGAQWAEVTVDDVTHRISIYVYWS